MGGRARIVAIALVLQAAVGLGLGGAPARAATPPPNLTVEVAGYGRVAGTGIACGEGALTCFASYGVANPVTLTATPGPGWTFSHWEDTAAGCGTATCAVTPDTTGTVTATAVFTTTGGVTTHTFDVSSTSVVPPPPTSPTDLGTVSNSSTNYAIDCDPVASANVCSLTVLQGSTITVDEAPTASAFFAGWGGACSGTRATCSVYVTADQAISADFVSSSPTTLSVAISGDGSVSGGGISCSAGGSCDGQEPPNATVTLTASAANGFAFTGWSGDCSGTQSTCSVQMDVDRSVSASFASLVPLTVTVSGNGTVTGAGIDCGTGATTCSAGQAPLSTVTLTAAPVSGASVFWSGCSTSSGNTCTVTMGTTATSVSATFSGGTAPPVASNSLTVGVTGDGYVTASTGSSTIYCTAAGGPACTANVVAGTTVTLNAVPASGVSGNFSHWTGDCATFATTSCTLTMNGAKSVGATFAGGSTTYVLAASASGSGSITGAGLDCTSSGGSGCSASQAAGAAVTITAAPTFGATFAGWGGACSGTSPTCSVTMSLARTVTATFTATSFGTQSLAIEVSGAGSVKAPGGTCASTAGKTKLCTQSYDSGKAVALTAKAAPGYAFAGWKGACTGAKASCTVTLSSSTDVTATFARPPLAATRKPVIVKTKAGYEVTLYYAAGTAGTLKLAATRSGASVLTSSTKVKAGAGKIAFTVARAGRYVFTLTLGSHSIRWGIPVR